MDVLAEGPQLKRRHPGLLAFFDKQSVDVFYALRNRCDLFWLRPPSLQGYGGSRSHPTSLAPGDNRVAAAVEKLTDQLRESVSLN